MPTRVLRPPTAAALGLALLLFAGCQAGVERTTVRVATFNTALSRNTEGALHAAFAAGNDDQARLVAEVLQRTRPDIVLLQEVDYDPTGRAYADFQNSYLSVPQNGAEPIYYEYIYAPPVNTGVLADVDLDGDGKITRPNDSYGYGLFEGHYGMVVLSRYPIDEDAIRTFQYARWATFYDGNFKAVKYYSNEGREALRLSSKTHADIPVSSGSSTLHLLVSHPTPPIFDGPEDRNGIRNEDEIRFWAKYIRGNRVSSDYFEPTFVTKASAAARLRFFTDDSGRRGYPDFKNTFVILGDLNADPYDGGSRPDAALYLIESSQVNSSMTPTSLGAAEAARRQAGANLTHQTDPATDTADFGDTGNGPGNLRVDYVLPSVDLDVVGAGVYWPTTDDPYAYLNAASDHKLVWIDLMLPE